MNTTLYATLSTATGDSPYEINTNTEVSSGKGYYSAGGGVSMSKVVDPVVLFGSVGYTHAFDATDLKQARGSRILEEVETGDSLSFSMGFAYSLSYEVSLSASYQQSYNFDTRFNFSDGTSALSEDSTSSVINTSMGLRTASNRIINISFGYGLTEDSPDVLLGFSVPVDITGLKPGTLLRGVVAGVAMLATGMASAQLATNIALDVRAMSLGHAVTADPPGIMSIHFNPAGLARLEGRRMDLQFLGVDFALESEFSAPPGFGVFGFSDDPVVCADAPGD
ncbi:Flagellar protein FilC, partial [Durusdinium trenchii]